MYIDILKSKINQSKYLNVYINIIERALLRVRDESTYYEKHHILPKCMCDDNKQKRDKINLVYLTAKEHYIAHILLWKATNDSLLAYSVKTFIMSNKRVLRGNMRFNSNLFARAREESRIYNSKNAKEWMSKKGHPRTGAKLSDDTKNKIKSSLIGTNQSDDTKEKISSTLKQKYSTGEINAPNKGRVWDNEYKQKMSETCSKVIKSDEWNKKNSLSNMGRIHIANTITKKRKRPLKEDAEKLINESKGVWIKLHATKPIPDYIET